MARIVKEEEYALRRNDILNVAQHLLQTKGYGQMSIQDILDELKISKGAFYHYFDSKHALLEATIESIIDEIEKVATPIVSDPDMSAVEKLERVFSTISGWKTAQIPYYMDLLYVWYADDNAIVRQKVETVSIKRVGPMINEVIYQGIREGVFNPSHPSLLVNLILTILTQFGNTLAMMIITKDPSRKDPRVIQEMSAAYTDAIERLLGMPKETLQLYDLDILMTWMVQPEEKSKSGDGDKRNSRTAQKNI
jgi:AcrR family transcriptional regulator